MHVPSPSAEKDRALSAARRRHGEMHPSFKTGFGDPCERR